MLPAHVARGCVCLYVELQDSMAVAALGMDCALAILGRKPHVEPFVHGGGVIYTGTSGNDGLVSVPRLSTAAMAALPSLRFLRASAPMVAVAYQTAVVAWLR